MDISTATARDKLSGLTKDGERRREPYWASLGTGRHIGYRVTSNGGTWVARVYDAAATPPRQTHPIGDVSNISYTEAVKRAQAFFNHIDGGGRTEAITVAQAWQNYIDHTRADTIPKMGRKQKRKRGREAAEVAAVTIERRFKNHVLNDPIGKLEVGKLKQRDLEAWVNRRAQELTKPPKRGPNCRVKTPNEPKAKSDATMNRDMGTMKAALNLALHESYATTDKAWSAPLAPNHIDAKAVRRDLYLSIDQRKALLDAIDDNSLKAFVEVLCRLPLRPGAVAALEVRDLKGDTLTIRKDKGHDERSFTLSHANAAMLRKHAKNKFPQLPLLTQANGKPWNKDAWKKPIKDAVLKAGLPPAATAYTLRHSSITDYVNTGTTSLEIAHLSGTSVAMIEKHYYQEQADVSRKAQDAAAGGWS